jgi:hypothetical protein
VSGSGEPHTYYCAASGLGQVMNHHHADRPRNVAVIGLGAGSTATWGKPGDRFRYYEINPAVEAIARQQFTYLAESRATTDVVIGDARLTLGAEESGTYDVIAVDAFSGDAIPVHLITREAFALYFRVLKSDGVIAVHISNRYMDLEPVVADAAAAFGRTAHLVESEDSKSDKGYCFNTSWVVVGGDPAMFEAPEVEGEELLAPTPHFRPWTDDYSNVISVVR